MSSIIQLDAESPLIRTIARIKPASVWSWRNNDTAAAPIKIRMIGLLNCANSRTSEEALRAELSRFRPDFARRSLASLVVRPTEKTGRSSGGFDRLSSSAACIASSITLLHFDTHSA